MAGKIRLVVHGAMGRMGQQVMASMSREADMQVIGGVDKAAKADVIAVEGSSYPLGGDLASFLASHPADVVVDFSVAEAGMAAARAALPKGVRMVVGTTGFSRENIAEVETLCKKHNVGAVIASNFALGAVLMVHLSKLCSKYFDYAEIIELHHEKKLDAPSGTALSTARAMAQARGSKFQYPQVHKQTLAGARGGETEGIGVHSVRLPGLLAHQEVIFGGPGQTLTIRHDTISRECFMPGVALAIREVMKRNDLAIDLDRLLGL